VLQYSLHIASSVPSVRMGSQIERNNAILFSFFFSPLILAIIATVKLKPSSLKYKQRPNKLSLCQSVLKRVGPVGELSEAALVFKIIYKFFLKIFFKLVILYILGLLIFN